MHREVRRQKFIFKNRFFIQIRQKLLKSDQAVINILVFFLQVLIFHHALNCGLVFHDSLDPKCTFFEDISYNKDWLSWEIKAFSLQKLRSILYTIARISSNERHPSSSTSMIRKITKYSLYASIYHRCAFGPGYRRKWRTLLPTSFPSCASHLSYHEDMLELDYSNFRKPGCAYSV